MGKILNNLLLEKCWNIEYGDSTHHITFILNFIDLHKTQFSIHSLYSFPFERNKFLIRNGYKLCFADKKLPKCKTYSSDDILLELIFEDNVFVLCDSVRDTFVIPKYASLITQIKKKSPICLLKNVDFSYYTDDIIISAILLLEIIERKRNKAKFEDLKLEQTELIENKNLDTKNFCNDKRERWIEGSLWVDSSVDVILHKKDTYSIIEFRNKN